MDNEMFCNYVASILCEAGHMNTSEPIFINHTFKEAIYIDSGNNVVLKHIERELLSTIENVSLITEMKWNIGDLINDKIQIYSVTCSFPENDRSAYVADVHKLLHEFWECDESIVFFKNDEEFIISFADNEHSHVLSDWFDIVDDFDKVVEKIDISCLCIDNKSDYFSDFVFAVARDYYFNPISFEEASYDMLPINYVSNCIEVDYSVPKEEIKTIIRTNLKYYDEEYGCDYVDPQNNEEEKAKYKDLNDELEKMSFEMDEIELEETEQLLEESDYYDESFNELEGFNPEIFDDPELMVKWLEKQPNNVKKKQRENIKDDELSKRYFTKETENEELLVDKKEQISAESIEEKSHKDSSNNESIFSLDEKNENLNQNDGIHLMIEENYCKRLNALENNFIENKSDILCQIKTINEIILEKTKKINRLSFVQLFEKRTLRKEIEQLQQEKFEKQKRLDLLKKEYENKVEEENNNYLRESGKK